MKSVKKFSTTCAALVLFLAACHRSETRPLKPAASQAPMPPVAQSQAATAAIEAAPIPPFVGEIEVLHESIDERGRPLERLRLLGREILTIDGALERHESGPTYSITDWKDGTLREVNVAQRYVMVFNLRKREHPHARPFIRNGRASEIAGIKCDWGRAETDRETADVCVAEGYGGRSLMNRYFGTDAALNWPNPLLILEADLPSNSAILRRRVVRVSRGPVPPERFSVPADYKVEVMPDKIPAAPGE